MTPKQYLMQYRTINRRIDSLMRERDRTVMLATTVQAIDYGRDCVQSSHEGSPVEASAYKLIELEERISSEIDELLRLRDEVCAAIDAVPNDTYKLLLRLRYIDGMTWESIAERMNYDIRHITRLHGRALQHVLLCP